MTLPEVAEALAVEMERTVSAFENRDKGGMQVPFHGDFASAPPSVIGRFRWWVRELRAALSSPSAPGPEVPEEVRVSLSSGLIFVSLHPMDDGAIKAAKEAALAAISRALATVREEALREAAQAVLADAVPVFDEPVLRRAAARIRALSAARPAASEPAPGMTDLMVTPEAINEVIAACPPAASEPESLGAARRDGGGRVP